MKLLVDTLNHAHWLRILDVGCLLWCRCMKMTMIKPIFYLLFAFHKAVCNDQSSISQCAPKLLEQWTDRPSLLKMNAVIQMVLLKILRCFEGVHFSSNVVHFWSNHVLFRCAENHTPQDHFSCVMMFYCTHMPQKTRPGQMIKSFYRGFSRRGTHPVRAMSRRHVGFFWNKKICFNFVSILFEKIKLTVSE